MLIVRFLQKIIAVQFLIVRGAMRMIIWPAGVVWSYFADATNPPNPEDLRFADRPIFLHGTNGIGVLLLHGWTSTPYEMRALARHLNAAGYTVSAPLLSGHGTVPYALEHVTYKDWIADAQHYYNDLRGICTKVFVGGMSMGGSLALIVAQRNRDVAGVIAMGVPLKFRRQRLAIIIFALLRSLRKYEQKHYPVFRTHPQITRLVTYQTYPIDSALEVFRLAKVARRGVQRITQPILIIQSLQDHIVTRSSIYELYLRVRSRRKKKILLSNAYHNFIADAQHQRIYDDIAQFITENC